MAIRFTHSRRIFIAAIALVATGVVLVKLPRTDQAVPPPFNGVRELDGFGEVEVPKWVVQLRQERLREKAGRKITSRSFPAPIFLSILRALS